MDFTDVERERHYEIRQLLKSRRCMEVILEFREFHTTGNGPGTLPGRCIRVADYPCMVRR